MVAPARRSQEGGILPGRRDLGAMEEKDEGSIGLSPNLSFLSLSVESESILINGQSILYFVQFLKRPVWRKISTTM